MSFNHPCEPEMHYIFETLDSKEGSNKLLNYMQHISCHGIHARAATW